MADQFTTVTTQGYGSRIMGAIVGVPIGLLIIVISIGVLYWNEGRIDPSKVAQQSVAVNPQHVDASANGKFVSVTGAAGVNQTLGDGTYLKPGPYVAVQRVVEEYAWVQDQSSQSQDNAGGSQTTTTTYTYKQAWTDNPADSSTFHEPSGHQNPAKPLSDVTVRATSAKVGAYSIDPQTVSLPSLQAISLSATNTTLGTTGAPASAAASPPAAAAPPSSSSTTTPASVSLSSLNLADSTYLFAGTGSLTTPQVGDIRISYLALPAGTNVTVFGLLNGSSVTRYTNAQNYSMYSLLLGDRNTAIATLHTEYLTLTWILRIAGLIGLWVGLMMLVAPLNVILDFLPIAGEISSGITFIITLPLALLIGGTVILISYTLHHVIALIIAVPVVFGLGLGVFKLIKHGRGIGPRSAASAPMAPMAGAAPAGGGSLFPTATPSAAPPAAPVVLPPVSPAQSATPPLVTPPPPPIPPTPPPTLPVSSQPPPPAPSGPENTPPVPPSTPEQPL